MCVSILTQVACAYVCGHERMCVGMCVCVCACMEDSLRRHVRMCVRVHGELTREACYCRRAPRRGFVVCATPLSPLLSFLHVRGMHIMPPPPPPTHARTRCMLLSCWTHATNYVCVCVCMCVRVGGAGEPDATCSSQAPHSFTAVIEILGRAHTQTPVLRARRGTPRPCSQGCDHTSEIRAGFARAHVCGGWIPRA